MIASILLPSMLGFIIFLCGMKLMELALFRMGGPAFLRLLERSTQTPLHGLILGTASTAFLQSSTAVTALSISLVNSRLLPFSRTLGIILGTNIGTCLTTELIGLNIFHWAKPIIGFSFVLWTVSTLLIEYRLVPKLAAWPGSEYLRSASVVLFGFGMLLFGITVMQSIGPSLQQTDMYSWFLQQAQTTLLWGVLTGAVLTACFHSSSAVIAMIMGIAALDTLPLELCIAIVLGSNIGTCFTAILASIGGTKGGQFVAISHLLLNIGGAALFYPFINLLASAVLLTTDSIPTAIAHSQTIFNVLCSFIALPICYLKWFSRLDQV
ncbi:Na/Pi cotransporter family protein [Paenibacillus septentrionalis]|uniref:Na/Pi cotransporter family protein n=1 Tax=Paenibacillus septentrionalis TaxID=429342 RepID=A0ABW1V3W2_9BACL